nr:tyrosine--tRNA ligase [Bacteroidia bacterium]
LLSQPEIETIELNHQAAPHERHLQKALAKEITIRVHSEADYNDSVATGEFLFKAKADDISSLDTAKFEKLLSGIDTFEIHKNELATPINIVNLLVEKAEVFPSNNEARKMITGNALSVNKTKITDVNTLIDLSFFSNQTYLLISKGKKENYLIKLI